MDAGYIYITNRDFSPNWIQGVCHGCNNSVYPARDDKGELIMTIVQCAWCKIIIQVKEGDNICSHGICRQCLAKMMLLDVVDAEIKETKEEAGDENNRP